MELRDDEPRESGYADDNTRPYKQYDEVEGEDRDDWDVEDNIKTFAPREDTHTEEGDSRPKQNDPHQAGYGIDDGPTTPLSREGLDDLQDAGQQDLARQREEEKRQEDEDDSSLF